MAAGPPDWQGGYQVPSPTQTRVEGEAANEPRSSGPERIKRPHNAWIIYRTEKSRELRDSFLQGLLPTAAASSSSSSSSSSSNHAHLLGTGATPKREADLSKYLAAMWKNETPEVKEKYAERARAEREAHLQRHPGYRFQPRKLARSRTLHSAPMSTAQDRANEKDWVASNHRSGVHPQGRSNVPRSHTADGPRARTAEDTYADDFGRNGQQGRFPQPLPAPLSQSSQFGYAPVSSGQFPAQGSSLSIGRDGQMPLHQPMSAPADVSTYQMAASQRSSWSGHSNLLPMDAPTSRSLQPGSNERLPSMHTSALVAASDRPDQTTHTSGSMMGKAVPSWSYGGQSAYPPAHHQTLQDTRATASGRNHSASGLAAPQSQYMTLEQSSLVYGRPTAAPSDQWPTQTMAPLFDSGSVAAPSPSNSSFSGRQRSSSTYSSGMVAPQAQSQGHQQPSFFQNQLRMSHQQHPTDPQALLVHHNHPQYLQHNHPQHQHQQYEQHEHAQFQHQHQHHSAASSEASGNASDLVTQQHSLPPGHLQYKRM
ncbi:hypothetical protein CF319_g7057 [Tilletia indica]|nr:hypothetical protein CF319_g7057 [Tilletia indica]